MTAPSNTKVGDSQSPKEESAIYTLSDWIAPQPREGMNQLGAFFREHRDYEIDHSDFIFRFYSVSPNLCHIAIYRETIVGAIGALFIDDANRHVWIANFHVRPDLRGKGIGRALWAHLWAKLEESMPLEIGGLHMGLTCYFTNPILALYKAHGFKPIENFPSSHISDWDILIYRGLINEKVFCAEYEASRTEFRTFSILPTPVSVEISDAIVALDARLSGATRSHFLSCMARGAFKVIECWKGTELIGYSIMLDVGEYFWLFLVAATEREAGYAQIFYQLAAAIASKNSTTSNQLLEDTLLLNSKPVTQKCCCGTKPPTEESYIGTKVLLAGLRRPMEYHGVRALVERLGLESLGTGSVFTYSPENVIKVDSTMVLFKDTKRQKQPDHLFIVPPGVTVIF